MEIKVFTALQSALERGDAVAQITLLSSEGSTPAREGMTMIVLENGASVGTIGGGMLEHTAIQEALAALKDGKNRRFSHTLESIGMTCGGSAEGYINVFRPRAKLVIFGAGHVARALAAHAALLRFSVYVADDRADYAELPAFAGVTYLAAPPAEAAESIPWDENTYIVVATRGHRMDYDALQAVLGRPRAYLGMVGSRGKVQNTRERLLADGYDAATIESIYSPVGLDISDGTPEEIAISILAEILAVKNGREGRHMTMGEFLIHNS